MSLRIYLDDCADARELVALLHAAGHEVVIPAQAGTTGRSDDVHFCYAAEHALLLLTKNPDDFVELHAQDANHAGILLSYQDNDPDRDMKHSEVVRAIGNLESAGVPLASACHVLDARRY